MLKLVATDLDGTLLHSDGTVTGRTRAVLAELERRGVTVVFVTGRPPRWMDRLWSLVGDHGLAVLSNGGIVYDVRGHTVVRSRPIPREVGLSVAGVLREGVPGTGFALERTDGFARERDFHPHVDPPTGSEIGPLPDLFTGDVVKLLARHEELPAKDFWARAERLVGDAVTTTWSSVDGDALVEMSAAGVTKASTLELVCADLGVRAEEVVAFGDMPNDVAMLTWAGTSYAMANGHPTAVAAASGTAPANDDDGVARVLEELFGR